MFSLIAPNKALVASGDLGCQKIEDLKRGVVE